MRAAGDQTISPLDGSKPSSAFSRTVFSAPFGPRMLSRSRDDSSKLTSSTTNLSWMRTDTFLTASKLMRGRVLTRMLVGGKSSESCLSCSADRVSDCESVFVYGASDNHAVNAGVFNFFQPTDVTERRDAARSSYLQA